jgi:phospholipid/cholesterol/gamma-HCH transport system ATP-binding protein
MRMRSGARGERVPDKPGRSRDVDDPVLRRVIRREMDDPEGRAGAEREGAEVVIELEDVHLSFDQPILKGMSLKVREGETLLVLGESGIGKSTILKLILRLLVPESGRIRVLGRETRDISFEEALEMRRKIGMVFQNAALFDSVNVFDNVAYPLRENTKMSESEIERVVRERLEFVDLDPATVSTKLPGELSGGMKKRVGIARAIATDPLIVLYDEPTAGLDPLTVGTIGDLIRKLQKELGVTSIVVTHDIRAGFRVASRVNLIREGRIAFDGTPEDMIAADDAYIQRFLALS